MNEPSEESRFPSHNIPATPGSWPGIWTKSTPHKFAILLLLLIHSGFLAYHGQLHSPGWDEVGHFGSGVIHVQTGVFDLYRVNPPLVRTWACLAPVAAGLRSDLSVRNVYSRPGDRREHGCGQLHIKQYGPNYMYYLSLARLMCIPFSLLDAMAIYDLSNFIFGSRSALLAVSLWCFSPLVIGHGAMITPDVPAATFACLMLNAMTRWVPTLKWKAAIIAGVALGIAILTKLTNLVLIPIVIGIAIATLLDPVRRQVWKRLIVQLSCVGAIAIYVINMGYGFERTLQPLGEYQFVSELFAGELPSGQNFGNRFQDTIFDGFPVPLPANVLNGIDVQRRDFQNGMTSYLAGTWQNHGWWYYYLYAFQVKEPVGTLLLLFLGAVALTRLPSEIRTRCLIYVVVPLVAIVTFVSSQTGFNHHLRYLLPAYPFAYVLASGIASQSGAQLRRFIGVCLVSVVVSACLAMPHSISFFNVAIGGPLNGPYHLHNSNVDWGQDALFLEDWLERNPEARPVQVDFSGGFNPADLEIWGEQVTFKRINAKQGEALQQGEQSQIFAISLGHFFDPHDRVDPYAAFRTREPSARIGYTIWVFEVDPSTRKTVKRET